MIIRRFTLTLIFIFLFSSCAPYQGVTPRLVIPANSLINKQTKKMVSVGVQPYSYSGEGLNYYEAGIFPLLVSLTNNSPHSVYFDPEAIVADSGYGRQYLSYRPQEAIKLVVNSQALQEAAKGAAKGAMVGTVTGTIVGLTLAAVLGVDPGESARIGAKTGFVGGGAGGGGVAVERLKAVVREEINTNGLRASTVNPGMTSTGWLFFPAGMRYKEVRITVSRDGTGTSQVFILPVSNYY